MILKKLPKDDKFLTLWTLLIIIPKNKGIRVGLGCSRYYVVTGI
jgi:hypothetical protein